MFGFKKKNDEKKEKKEKKEKMKTQSCAVGCDCCSKAQEKSAELNNSKSNGEGKAISVKVLGSGCKACHELYENVKQAVDSMDISAEVEYITDMQKVMEYGVMRMPALVVNGKVVSMGKVLKPGETAALFNELRF